MSNDTVSSTTRTANDRIDGWLSRFDAAPSRHHSPFLALQLKARMEGLDTPVHALAEVHHTS